MEIFSCDFVCIQNGQCSGFLPLDDLPTGKNGVYSNQAVDLSVMASLFVSVRVIVILIVE